LLEDELRMATTRRAPLYPDVAWEIEYRPTPAGSVGK
jgi:hypothetical protein